MITDGKKCYRITFSKSLADYIVKDAHLWVEKVQIFLTEDTSNGLYAVCKAGSLWPLRVTMFKDMADMWKNDSTVIMGCYIKRPHETHRHESIMR